MTNTPFLSSSKGSICVLVFSERLRGPITGGVVRGEGAAVLDISWKQGTSGYDWAMRGKKNEGGLRSEMESGVIKIHPTVQTKAGMKKRENAAERRE